MVLEPLERCRYDGGTIKTGKIPMRDIVDYHITGTGLRLTLSCRHEIVIPKTDSTAMRLHFRLLRGQVAWAVPCAACHVAERLQGER